LILAKFFLLVVYHIPSLSSFLVWLFPNLLLLN
jgi:hypothetical protein